ncbi:MAG: DJ-1/PfpI family protein [Massilia sp.]
MRLTMMLFDGFTALDVVGGYEVLAHVPGVEIEFAAESVGVVAADTGRLGIAAWRRFDEVASTDILYVPGGPGVAAAARNEALLGSVRRLDAGSKWTFGVCNGVELLGAAGLLEGKEVTTNLIAREQVAAYGALVQRGRYHRDGKLVTAAGVSASIDAGLYLAGLLAGKNTARVIQLGIEYYPDPPFGNGNPDDQPDAAKAIIRQFEQSEAQRLGSRTIFFARSLAST